MMELSTNLNHRSIFFDYIFVAIEILRGISDGISKEEIFTKSEKVISFFTLLSEQTENTQRFYRNLLDRLYETHKDSDANACKDAMLKLIDTEYYEFDFVEEDNKIQINLDKIDAGEIEYIDLYVKIKPSKSNIYDYNVNAYSVVSADGVDTYYSNENRQTIYFAGIEVIQTSEKEGKEVKVGEEIEYNFIIRNVSNKNIFDGDLSLHISDFLDENVEPVSAEYEVFTYNEDTEEYIRETKTNDFDNIIEIEMA